MAGFLSRHPSLKTQRAKPVDSVRINCATEAKIRPWFDLFKVPEIKAILAENRYNKDEAGIMEGRGTNGLVVGTADHKALKKKEPGGRTWTSFVECISATGRFLPPLVIFKGKKDMRPYKKWHFTATPKGWIDNKTALKWLRKVFIPLTRPARPSQKRLLIIDGHGSHVTVDYMWETYSNTIHIIYLPAHTSHVLQPLDLSCFSVLKKAYRTRLEELLADAYCDSSVAGKRAFLQCYGLARSEALTESNIKAGWKATGLWPINMAKPLMSKLLLKNSNQSPTPKLTSRNSDVRTSQKPILEDFSDEQVVWSTPRKSIEYREQARQFGQLVKAMPTDKLFLRKVGKAMDEKDFELAICKRRIEALEAELDRIQRTKRRKVELDLNTQFANIKTISAAQRAVGRNPAEDSDSEEEGDSSDIDSCIQVL